MAWLRVDDAFTSNAKVAQLTDSEFRVWMRLLCHCARSSDPSVDPAARREVTGLTAGRVRRYADLGLIDAVGGHHEVHDWIQYQPRDATGAERQAKWRARQAVTQPVTPAVTEPLPRARARARPRPVPSLDGSNEPQESERNQIWDSLTAVFGEAATRSAKSLRGKIVSSLVEAGVTAEQIRSSRAAWRKVMPEGTTFTETALEKHVGLLFANPASTGCPECGVGAGLHAADCSHATHTPASNGDISNILGEVHAHDR